MQNKSDERELIMKAAKGDLKAFEKIFEIYNPRLTDICLKEGLSDAQSAAVVKKTFEDLARKLSGIRSPGDFLSEMKSLCAKHILETKPSVKPAPVQTVPVTAVIREAAAPAAEAAGRREMKTEQGRKKGSGGKGIKWTVAVIAVFLLIGMCLLLLPGRTRRTTYEVPWDESLSDVYTGYLTVLAESRPMILNVKSLTDTKKYLPTVCIYDLTGDDVPELICVSNTFDYVRKLCIYTVKDGLPQELYSEYCYDLCGIFVSGSDVYFLTERNISAVEASFLKLVPMQDGSIGTERVLYSVGTSAILADGRSESLYAYYSGDQEVGKDIFLKEYKKLCSGMTLTLMELASPVSSFLDIPGGYPEKISTLQNAAMDCDSAMEKLSVLTGKGSTFLSVDALLSGLPRHFVFADESGTWATELDMYPDGSFSGTYHLYSSNGDKTVWQCLFRGVFSDISPIDPYSYKTTMKHVEIIETSEHYDVNGYRVVPSDPSGIINGSEYIIYRPGAFCGRISAQALNWAQWKSISSSNLVLPCWAIVSSGTGEAFFEDETVRYTPAAEGQAPSEEAAEEEYEEDYEGSDETEDY
ncbi:MAG: hypothetical protein IKD81_09220 [Eubacteriaceae bacterium]|nr:hypothetical protein [Eubacteriaceae bacterium]